MIPANKTSTATEAKVRNLLRDGNAWTAIASQLLISRSAVQRIAHEAKGGASVKGPPTRLRRCPRCETERNHIGAHCIKCSADDDRASRLRTSA